MIGPVSPRIHQDVRWLDITVYQACAVCGIQRRGDRGDERGGPARRQRPLTLQHPPQVTAYDRRIAKDSTPPLAASRPG